MTDQLTDDEIARLKSLGIAVQMFKTLANTSIPASTVAMFTAIATKEGRSVRDYANYVLMSHLNAGRTIADLSELNRYNGEGLGLILKTPGHDQREAQCRLTPKGRAFARRLANAISPAREAA
jgi:DNA-binding MarR family transcriptional regulator